MYVLFSSCNSNMSADLHNFCVIRKAQRKGVSVYGLLSLLSTVMVVCIMCGRKVHEQRFCEVPGLCWSLCIKRNVRFNPHHL